MIKKPITFSFKRHLAATALILCGALAPSLQAYAHDIIVGSWNIQRLGHGNQKSYTTLAKVANTVDLLAVQEVMTMAGIERLEKELEDLSQEPWSVMASHAIGSKNYKEMYAFLWRDSAVEYVDGAVVYFDPGNIFIREPYSAKFRSKRNGKELAVATVHVLYGKSIKDRAPEIEALADYWEWMASVYPDAPLMLVGDFNLEERNKVWLPLRHHAKPLITRGATTLSTNNGRYKNLYDNIWIERLSGLDVREAGIIEYPRLIKWDHQKSRRHVSDHAPVYVALGKARMDKSVPTRTSPPVGYVALPEVKAPARSSADKKKVDANAIVGNTYSKIYHRPDCPSYKSVNNKNKVLFNDAETAEKSGYRLAGNCPKL